LKKHYQEVYSAIFGAVSVSVISFPIFFIAFDTFEIVDCTVCRGVVETLGGGIVVVIGEGVDILGGAVKIVVLLCWNDGSYSIS